MIHFLSLRPRIRTHPRRPLIYTVIRNSASFFRHLKTSNAHNSPICIFIVSGSSTHPLIRFLSLGPRIPTHPPPPRAAPPPMPKLKHSLERTIIFIPSFIAFRLGCEFGHFKIGSEVILDRGKIESMYSGNGEKFYFLLFSCCY